MKRSITAFCLKKYFLKGSLIALMFFPVSAFSKPHNLFFDLDLTTKWDTNVNQAKLDTDSVTDTVTEASAAMGYQFEINRMLGLNVSTGLKTRQYKEVASQSSRSIVMNADLLWQNSIGFRAPLYQFSVNYEVEDNDTRQQTSTIINTTMLMSARLTDIVSGTVGLGYKYRDSESTVYDLTDYRFFISGDYSINDKLSAYSTINLIQGQTFSVVRADTFEEIAIALAVGANNIQWDDAFNEEFPSAVTPWRAYRVDASTTVFVLGLNYGFGHGNALDLSYTYADVSGQAGADYTRDIFSGSLMKRF